jgi:hypothetical protein
MRVIRQFLTGNNKLPLRLALAAVFLGVALFMLLHWAGGQAAQFIKGKIAAQDFLAGSVRVNEVYASFSGDVLMSDIVWTDPYGALVARIPQLVLSVRLRDLIGEGLDTASVETIMLVEPQLYLTYEERRGLNVLHLLKIKEREEKTGGAAADRPFRGSLEIEKGLLSVKAGDAAFDLDNLDAKLTWQGFPQVAGAMRGKRNKADFTGQLTADYSGEFPRLTLILEGRSIAVDDLWPPQSSQAGVRLSAGVLDELRVEARMADGRPAHIEAKGRFSAIGGQAEGLSFDQFQGAFAADAAGLAVTGAQGRVNGQQITAEGRLDLTEEPYRLAFKVKSDGFALNALSPGLTITDPLVFEAAVTGNLTEPAARGNFSAARIKTDQLELFDGRGDFFYENDLLRLSNARAVVYEGTAAAEGTVRLSDKTFNFFVRGSRLSSAALTETELRGPLSFEARVSGTAEAARAAGNFAVDRGDFNGLPFTLLTGNFVKQGEDMSFSNITINTLAGTVHTDAMATSGGKIKFGEVDITAASKEPAQKNVREELEKNAGKLADKLKKLF